MIMMMRRTLVAVALLVSQFATAQDLLIQKLKQHITVLASDSLEGRETGMKGETMASSYIQKQFKEIGLSEKGVNGYLQPFEFTRSTKAGNNNVLMINGATFTIGKQYYPLAYAANATCSGEITRAGYGITATALDYDDFRGRYDIKNKIVVLEYGTPDGGGPHSRYAPYADLRTRIDSAIAKGAVGVIFINSNKDLDNPSEDYKNKITPSTIPVVFVKNEAQQLLMSGARWAADITTELVKEEATGHNVIGFIDNKAANTVVIGAHYDHLGFGGDESLYRGKPAVHNGADDNASGVAALIEIARFLKNGNDNKNNYLLMAFSGEEKGLLGSNYFMKNPTVPLEKINYMINMDMLGRLKKEEPVLLINGAGTSPAWKITFNYVKIDSLKIKTTDSGIGPSDHTSFYLKDIPVLHFFSGTHTDYHKPSDDENLINYVGEERIINFITELIHRLDDKGKLDFTKTKDDSNDDTPRFKVTLGVVPDYAYEGAGMRIDGISEGKPASKAGLKAGDVVIQLGDYKVTDMTSYMKALSMFKKEDTTKVKVQRGEKELMVDLTF